MSGTGPDAKPVVVGVSPTSGSVAALLWAADEARRRSVRLVAVSGWRAPKPPVTSGARPPLVSQDAESAFRQAADELTEHVTAVLGPGTAECRLTEGSALKVLRQLSRQAALIVIDAPQRTDFSQSPRLAQRLVYRAECPVVVLPPAMSAQPETPLVRGTLWLGRRMAEAAADAGRPGLRMPRPDQLHGDEPGE